MKILYPKPKRLNYELELEETDKHRQFNCIFYDICLDHAAHFLYQSFSCQGCTWYHEDTKQFGDYFDYNGLLNTLFKCESGGTAYTEDLKSSAQTGIGVQIPSLAPPMKIIKYKLERISNNGNGHKLIKYQLLRKVVKYKLERKTDNDYIY